jgi:hypothetical protein
MTEVEMIELKSKIIVEAKKYLRKNYFIDLTGFIQNDMKVPTADAHTAFVRAVAHQMRHSGKYEIFEESNRYYLNPVPEKPWQVKYWWVIVLLTYISGLFTPALQKSIEQKMQQDTIQRQQAIPTLIDNSRSHKTY